MASKRAFLACAMAAAAALGCPGDRNDPELRERAGMGAGQNADSRPAADRGPSASQIGQTGMTNQNTGATIQGRRAPGASRTPGTVAPVNRSPHMPDPPVTQDGETDDAGKIRQERPLRSPPPR